MIRRSFFGSRLNGSRGGLIRKVYDDRILDCVRRCGVSVEQYEKDCEAFL